MNENKSNFDYTAVDFNAVVARVTGEKIVTGHIKCPFHDDSKASCQINDGRGGYPPGFYCHACKEKGDPIKFLMEGCGIKFLEAVKHLGLEDQLNIHQKQENKSIDQKVRDYLIQIGRRNPKILGFYPYEDSSGKILYYKVKYKADDFPKSYVTFHFNENNGIIPNIRGITRVPYNLVEAEKNLKEGIPVIITEGEKDVETIRKLGYVAISFKNAIKISDNDSESYYFDSDENKRKWKDTHVYFCGDTGKAGEDYRELIWNKLEKLVERFDVMELEGLKRLGENKDVTDWMEDINNYEEAKEEFNESMKDIWNWKRSAIWQDYIYDKRKKEDVVAPTIRNVRRFFEYKKIKLKAEEVSGEMKYNRIFKNLFINHLDGTYNPAEIQDKLLLNGCRMDLKKIDHAIHSILSERVYNYFQEICIKNRNKDHSLLGKVEEILNLPNDFQKRLFRKWMFTVVKQAFNSREKLYHTDMMLIMGGRQNIGKSTFFKGLAMNEEALFYSSQGLDVKSKDSIREFTSRNITELPELALNTKTKVNNYKGFLTQPMDRKRKMYGEQIVKYPRFTVFCGTTNDLQYLKDPTGSRRFAIIEPQIEEGELIKHIKEAGIDMNKVWGSIYDQLCELDPSCWQSFCALSSQEADEVNKTNAKYYMGGNVGSIIEDTFDMTSEMNVPITKAELYELLAPQDITQAHHNDAIENYLKNFGVKIRDDRGGIPLSRGVEKGKVVRAYTMWKIRDDWKPSIRADKADYDKRQIQDSYTKLKDKINARSPKLKEENYVTTDVVFPSNENIISENNIEKSNTSKLGSEKLMSGELVLNIEDGKRVPSAYKLHNNSDPIAVENYDSEVVELVDGTFVSFGSWRRFKTREELEDFEGLKSIVLEEEIAQEYCEADT